jgi:hypothetical protein
MCPTIGCFTNPDGLLQAFGEIQKPHRLGFETLLILNVVNNKSKRNL